jgi:hypothetical protein
VQDAQRGRIFPVHDFPRNQRVLRFRIADESCIFLAIVSSPIGQLLAAMPVAHGIQILARQSFRRAVAQRIQGNRIGRTRKRVPFYGSGEHRPLPVQPHQVAKKDHQDEHSGAHRNADLYAGKSHYRYQCNVLGNAR